MNGRRLRNPLCLLLLLGCFGCLTPVAEQGQREPEPDARLDLARRLFENGRYTDAIIHCIDLQKQDPLLPGLAELQARIREELAQERLKAAKLRSEATARRMANDVIARETVPDTYGLTRFIQGDTGSLRALPGAVEEMLRQNVSMTLNDVSVRAFIDAVSESEGVNIIYSNIDESQTMNLRVEDAPLAEVLDYASKNLGVTFSVGDNFLWVTGQPSDEPPIPLETRVYRLRKGMSSIEIEGGEDGINVVDAIRRFVPEVDGSDLLFSKKAHALIVKNTRRNLSRVEELIEALDVCPPQVLIEARFISTSLNDLRELGIDWVLESPIGVTTRRVLRNGVWVEANETQINEGADISFAGFARGAEGLNLTFQGLLTDPMFRAVLHALEVSGKAQTLSVPKVTTVNNTPASIRIGEDFRYFEEYDVEEVLERTDEGETTYRTVLVPVGTPQLEELGIELNVIPSVGADYSSVNLRLTPEISEFVRYESYEVSDSGSSRTSNSDNTSTNLTTSLVRLPIFRRSRIETEVVVQSGETVVMGGLIRSAESTSQNRVPFLGSIPFIGQFFRHDTRETTRENLLIFVTATILSDRGESLIPLTAQAAPAAEANPLPEDGE